MKIIYNSLEDLKCDCLPPHKSVFKLYFFENLREYSIIFDNFGRVYSAKVLKLGEYSVP